MYSKNINLRVHNVYNYNPGVNYYDALDEIMSNRYCRKYNLYDDEIVLSRLAYDFRSIMCRCLLRMNITENEVHVFFKSVKILKNVYNDCHDIYLKGLISDFIDVINDKFSIDGGKSTIDIDAFDSHLFMTLINVIGSSRIKLSYKRPITNLDSHMALKSIFILDKIHHIMNEKQLPIEIDKSENIKIRESI